LECVFAKEVWLAVEQWTDHLVQIPNPGVGLLQWWNRTTKSQPNDRRPWLISLLIYPVWNIWKERNRRIFEGKSTPAYEVLRLIKEEYNLRRVVCGDVSPPAGVS
jgi:hypothetical protein